MKTKLYILLIALTTLALPSCTLSGKVTPPAKTQKQQSKAPDPDKIKADAVKKEVDYLRTDVLFVVGGADININEIYSVMLHPEVFYTKTPEAKKFLQEEIYPVLLERMSPSTEPSISARESIALLVSRIGIPDERFINLAIKGLDRKNEPDDMVRGSLYNIVVSAKGKDWTRKYMLNIENVDMMAYYYSMNPGEYESTGEAELDRLQSERDDLWEKQQRNEAGFYADTEAVKRGEMPKGEGLGGYYQRATQ